VNLNYGRLYLDVRKQYMKLLGALVSERITPVVLLQKKTISRLQNKSLNRKDDFVLEGLLL